MTDDEDDPFADFDAPDDADPFEDLSDHEDEDAPEGVPGPDTDAETPPGRMPDDPFERQHDDHAGAESASIDSGVDDQKPHADEFDRDASAASGSPGTDSTAPTDDPFASFSQTQDTDDPFEAFEDVGVNEVDPDAVWDDLASERTSLADAEEKVYAEVSKHRFCERCPHFSGPPETTCNFEGAAIVEFLDMETVRVVNCPIVAEQRDLEAGGTDL